ncbi:hypothetical protein NQ317_007749 [Molorchus minor]|uniref:Uncharacterized protein n=1 Tax=Molorchus minor TaxID=1323400 RepID=A0ABQ9IQE4_9CUCU|nr:hypothetical protein NQ317_007749 [Molorchus minor]
MILTGKITYNLCIVKEFLKKYLVSRTLYSFSTAVLFHAAILNRTANLRPSYWKFLHSISGGEVLVMLVTFIVYFPLATAVFKLAVNGWRRHFSTHRLSASGHFCSYGHTAQ